MSIFRLQAALARPSGYIFSAFIYDALFNAFISRIRTASVGYRTLAGYSSWELCIALAYWAWTICIRRRMYYH
ncbi:hypothetical protein P154DRAFT_145500 [Amniculicola lignicola CBS 123094]|uniref:Uncharacterized protein n=1 Tax=Amniculicola lignicola CBS 123094 TaxID=1392246 RepID=A0A6A5WKE8_9PLEO|nr:hypothetical protein P154DRAFT_145500 [Amniculicola lignicola CBS 123094]